MKFSYDKFHKIHLWTDLSIGLIAIIAIFLHDIIEAWHTLDLAFHLIIFTLATGIIVVERLHHRSHKPEATGKGLHKVHFLADLSISVMAVVGLLFSDVLEIFFEVDMVFHILIFVLAIGGIVAEKFIFKHKHPGIIGS